jgi:endonuclease-3 related protein
MYERLLAHFGPLTGPRARRPWWPLYGDDPAFEILVGAVLVQQTRWETVEAAILRLIAAGLLSPVAMAAADPFELAALIRPAAFHTQKAPGLIAIAGWICERYTGDMAAMLAQPTATLRAELLALPRIGPETCDVIMLYGGGHPVFVVDEYTRRLFERVQDKEGAANQWRQPYELVRQKIETELVEEPVFDRSVSTLGDRRSALHELYAEFHAQINEACVRYCLARPRCDGPPARRIYSMQEGRESYLGSDAGCPLRAICGYYTRARLKEVAERS